MMKWIAILVFLFCPVAAHAQARDVSVRLYWLQQISEAKLTPQGELRIRRCRACSLEPVAQPLTVKAAESRLVIGDSASSDGFAEIAGPWRLEIAGHPAVSAHHRLALTAERGRLLLTIRMRLEDYVAAVLAGESSNFASGESLAAMAVAARTYAAHFGSRHQAEGFDFCDTTHCQDVRLGAASDRLRAAAEATAGELLWFEGRPAGTYYHRHCGGTTEAVAHLWPAITAPYLRQQADTYCTTRDRAEWNSEIALADLQPALLAAGAATPRELRSVEIVARTPSGRVAQLRLAGEPAKAIAAEAFRLAVGRTLGWHLIRSDFYEVRAAGNRITFRGFGAGHGVGLCQSGAARMGELGKSYAEILGFYYPGTHLGLTAQGVPWRAMAGERVEVLTTRPAQDQFVLALAERLLAEAEQSLGWTLRARPQVKIYPSVEVFRNATGEPGWVAASTRGRVVRLQPPEVLRGAGKLESTLRHELLHLLVESRARRPLPLWFREGLVLALEKEGRATSSSAPPGDSAQVERVLRSARSEAELRQAYRAAQALVESHIARFGRGVVLRWLEQGLPQELLAGGDGRR